MDADRQAADLSDEYLKKNQTRSQTTDVSEMEQYLAGTGTAASPQGGPQSMDSGDPGRPLPAPKALRHETDDSIGRFKGPGAEERRKSFMRNAAEAPGQAVAGVESALKHALGWAIDPMANWLNENVADLSYKNADPATPTGAVTKATTEFLTGFIPALKGFRALGLASRVTAPLAAGALASFAVQDPAAGRLSDLWKKLDLPQNILTDYLSSKPDDNEMEARFKNAVEGTGLGVLAEGVVLGARVLRSAMNMRGAKQTEAAYLKGKYGEVDDETFNKIIGDPSKPSVEMVVHQPSEVGAKVAQGMADTETLDPRSLVRGVGRARKASEAEVAAAAKSAGMSRRDFLKATTAVAANAATGGGVVGAAVKAAVGGGGVAEAMAAPFIFRAATKAIPWESLLVGGGGGLDVNVLKRELPEAFETLKKAGAITPEIEKAGSMPFDMGGYGDRGKSVPALDEFIKKQYPHAMVSDGYYAGITRGGHLGDEAHDPVSFIVQQEARSKGIRVYGDEAFVDHMDDVLADTFAGDPVMKQKWYDLGLITKKGEIKQKVFNNQELSNVYARELDQLEFHWGNAVGEGEKLGVRAIAADEAAAVESLTPAARLVAAADRVASGGKLSEAEAKEFPQLANLQVAKQIAAGKDAAGELAKPAIKPEDFSVYVNFAKFDEPDQIKFAIGKLAEHAQGSIDEATRGTITHAETEKMADTLGMTVTELLERRHGQPFNAEEAVAARQLWAASAEKLVELAKTAAGKNAGPLDQFAFRKQMAVHAAIQSEIIGARTETARALSSWNIPVKGGIDRARAIDQIMAAMGGPEASSEMARRLAILAETNANPDAIAKFVEKGWGAATADAVREAWINGLLSNPKTHVVNMTSNTIVAFTSILERAAAGGIRAFTGGEGVELGEAAAMTYGMVSSLRDAWRLAAKAVKTGETSWTFNKMDLPQTHAISPEAFGMAKDTAFGRAIDFIGTGARVPTRLLGAEDEFFKAIGYRAELHAQALRQASQEGLTGYALGKRMAEIVRDPPEHIMINAADAALYQTFTNEVGNFGKAIMNLRSTTNSPYNPMTFVLPFVRTPVNIIRYAMERTPFAPLVSQWRADVAAGGARADLALARMSTGTMVMLTAMDYADKGLITGAGFRGGKDTAITEAEQRQGMTPYSVKVGNRWYSYNRTDPFGMTIGFAASIAEAVKKGEISADEVDEWQEVMAMSIAAVSQVVVNKTYLQGFANFVEVLSDPKRYSQAYVDNLFASFLPLVGLSTGVKNTVDPVAREVNNPQEAVMSRIAGLSDKLPPRRDLWGKELRPQESGLGKAYDFLSPVAVKPEEPNPIDREMVRINHGVERIKKQTSFDGVQANMRFYPKVYDDYTRLAGNDLKSLAHGGMGAKDYLNSVVTGANPVGAAYAIMPDESRKAFIESTIQDFRKQAQRQILQDPQHARFAAEIARLKEIHQGARMPVMQ